MNKIKGTVKWWNDSKGYGFIAVGEKDVFAHYTAILGEGFKTLNDNQLVEFTLVDGPKGPQAMDIVKLSNSDFSK